MTQGYVFFGVDDDGSTQNLDCAHALNSTLKLADPDRKTCVIINAFDQMPEHIEDDFDYIAELPFGRNASDSTDPMVDFWQMIHCTPFDESMFLNTFSLAINNMNSLWEVASQREMTFAKARDFRGECTIDVRRISSLEAVNIKPFDTDCIYVPKTERTYEFFKMADPVLKGWRDVYREVLTETRPANFVHSVMSNITMHLLGEQPNLSDTFDYQDISLDFLYDSENDENPDWLDTLNVWLTDDLRLKINNYNQNGLVVYRDRKFLTDSMKTKINEHYKKSKIKIKA